MVRSCLGVLPAATVAAGACSDSAGPTRMPASIRFDQPTVTPNDDQTLQLVARVLDQKGSELGALPKGQRLVWTTSDPRVATVDTSGLVRAIQGGSARIGVGSGTRGAWLRRMRSTVIHEVKHITANAEHLRDYHARGDDAVLEELWLEEATAQAAEELWARTVLGYAAKGNVRYEQSLYCEVRPSWPECAGKPYVMGAHFSWLYDYLESVETLTPVMTWEDGGRSDGAHFYGSGWALVRWAADHAALSEAEFFRALNLEKRLVGVQNLEARTGRSFAELMRDWALALALDDLPGFRPASPETRLAQPGWNVRDIYARLNADFAQNTPNPYPAAFPLAVREVGFGRFDARLAGLRGGSAAYVPPVRHPDRGAAAGDRQRRRPGARAAHEHRAAAVARCGPAGAQTRNGLGRRRIPR